MTLKFSPRFTIETAYPMMFSADDIKYLETDIFNAISDKVYLPQSLTAPWEMEELSVRFNRFLNVSFPQGGHIIQRLEHLWIIDPVDHPQDLKRR